MTEKPLSEKMEKAYNNMSTFSYAWIEAVEALEAEVKTLRDACNTCQMHNPTLQVRRQRLTIANLEAEVKTLKENSLNIIGVGVDGESIPITIINIDGETKWVLNPNDYKTLKDRLEKAQEQIKNWRGRADHYYGKKWFEESGILNQCADELEKALDVSASCTKGEVKE